MFKLSQMTQFEALTAHRAVTSESLITDARQAVDEVLGEGAVNFSMANGSNLDLLSEEELAVIQRNTEALGELPTSMLIQKTCTLMPSTFKEESSSWLYLPQIVPIESLTGKRREFVLTLSNIKRHRRERNAFTGAIDALTGESMDWQKFVPGVKLGTVAEGLRPKKDELREIKRRMPTDRTRLKRGKAKRTKVVAA